MKFKGRQLVRIFILLKTVIIQCLRDPTNKKNLFALMRFEIVCIPASNCIESLIHFQTRKSIWWSSVLSRPGSTSSYNWKDSIEVISHLLKYYSVYPLYINSPESSVGNLYQRNPFWETFDVFPRLYFAISVGSSSYAWVLFQFLFSSNIWPLSSFS